MSVVKGEHRLMLKYAKNFDIGFVGCNHELLHIVSECNPINLVIVFLIGLEDKLVGELDNL